MTVKDLQIDSPVYRISLDTIEIAHVRLIEAFNDGTRSVELNTTWMARCNAKNDATEIREKQSERIWYLNVEDAKLAQIMRRAEHVEKLKTSMVMAQTNFADAIRKYAFSEPSTPQEL